MNNKINQTFSLEIVPTKREHELPNITLVYIKLREGVKGILKMLGSQYTIGTINNKNVRELVKTLRITNLNTFTQKSVYPGGTVIDPHKIRKIYILGNGP